LGVFEQLFPGEVVQDVDGLAVPIAVPTGTNGPDMVKAVSRQLRGIMNAIRSAILNAYSSAPLGGPASI
jgi:hypothetical protein